MLDFENGKTTTSLKVLRKGRFIGDLHWAFDCEPQIVLSAPATLLTLSELDQCVEKLREKVKETL